MTLFTLGHSVRSLEATLALLQENRVAMLVDVRMVTRSRRNPQYAADAFAAALNQECIAYRHMPALGGMRQPRANSPNLGLCEPGFRGFADYMLTPAFEAALAELMAFAAQHRTACLCAEAKPSECHRSLISDALTARGCEVLHILGPNYLEHHVYTAYAEVQGGRVRYPFRLESPT